MGTDSFLANDILCCPIDRLPLRQQGHCLSCDNGHSYDIARQGYVNLLAASDKRSKDPGDSREMVAARGDFFDGGFYQPVAQQLVEGIAPPLEDGAVIVDAGCGEGYYLQYLQQQLEPAVDFVGFDISKWAVQAAARRCPATWFVASNRNIPIADGSVDVLLSLFGFPAYDSFRRILKAGATLVLVNAGPRHLLELREVIYDRVKSSHSPELEEAAAAGFVVTESRQLEFATPPLNQTTIIQLLGMTPHLFRASREGKEKAGALQALAVTVDVNFHFLTRQ